MSIINLPLKNMIQNSFISIFKSVDLAKRKIPMIVHKSDNPGPTIWVVAAIHGDEVTGTETVIRLNRYLKRKPLTKGTVYTIPVINPIGFELITRQEPTGYTDLNRCFPGRPDGNTAQRMAYKIFTTIRQTKPDLVIDLHTDTMESIPYIYLDQVLDQKDKPILDKILQYSNLSGINYFIENAKSYTEDIEKSITGTLINIAKIPAFTIELGGPLVVKDKFVEIGLNVIKNILSNLEMIQEKQNWVYYRKIPLAGLYETTWNQYTPDYSGIVDYLAQPGDIVTTGTSLARIKNLFDKTIQVIKAKEESVIISYADQSVCFPGVELIMLARRNDNAFQFI